MVEIKLQLDGMAMRTKDCVWFTLISIWQSLSYLVLRNFAYIPALKIV